MVSGSERKALEIVFEEGGEASSHKVSRRLGIDTGYGSLLCMNLSKGGYVMAQRSRRFSITLKGKQALGKASHEDLEEERVKGSLKGVRRENFGWDVLRNVGSRYRSSSEFSAAHDQELMWNPVRINGSETESHFSRKLSGRGVVRLYEETSHPCGFCKGKGKKSKGNPCQVCKGSGKVSVNPPTVRCAFCRGRGEERHNNNWVCPICKGKGFLSVTSPVETCSQCRGAGATQNNLSCHSCGGKGVVTVRSSRKK